MHKKFKERKRLVVYLDAGDYELLQQIVDGKSLSEWARSTLLGALPKPSVNLMPTRRVPLVTHNINNAAVSPLPPKGKTCPHGVNKGYNCWQCGGLAIV